MSRLFTALRRPNLRWLIAGAAVSLVGDGIYTVAIAVAVLDAGHGASGLATLSIAMLIPRVLFGLWGGVLADRVSRRSILVACDLVRASVVTALGATLALGASSIWLLAVMVIPLGAATGVASPAFSSIIPDLVDGDQLVLANAALGGIGPLAQVMVGPALGGILAAHDPGVALLVDGGSFAVSALCVLLLRPARHHAARERDLPWVEFRAGVTYVRRTPWLAVNLLCALVLTFAVAGALNLLPLLVTEGYGADASSLGFVLAVGGAAGTLGALVAGMLPQPRRLLAASYVAYILGLGAVIGLGLVHGPVGAAGFAALLFVGTSLGNVYQDTMIGHHVPRELLGRVRSLDWVAATAMVPLSIVVAAAASGAIGIRATYVVSGALTAGVAALSLGLLLHRGEPTIEGADDRPDVIEAAA